MLRGAAVSLICKTDANPEAHIYRFYFNGNLIGNSSSGVFNVTTKAGGEYTCVSINTVGAGDNATVRITTMGKHIYISLLLKQTHRHHGGLNVG